MAKVTLTPITSGYATAAALNANFTAIATALDNTVSRDGTAPNALTATLDVNSNRLINLPDAITGQEPVTLSQLVSAGTNGSTVASNVLFTQSGAGAIDRTMQSKGRAAPVSLSDFCTGVGDEGAAIQAAVNASAGRVLEVDINVSTSVTINGISFIAIRDAGGSITNIDPSAVSDIPLIRFVDKTNFSVNGVRLVGTNKSVFAVDNSGSAISIEGNCDTWSVTDCELEGHTLNGIRAAATVGKTLANGTIAGNYCLNNGATAINTGTGTHTGADIIIIGEGTGIAKNIGIHQNRCIGPGGVGIGLSFAAAATGDIGSINISGNLAKGKGQHGFMLYPEHTVSDSEYAPHDVTITGNTAEDCNWMGFYGVGKLRNVTVIGNTAKNCCVQPGSLTPGVPATPTLAWGGIAFAGAGTLGRAANVTITGNTVDGFNGYSGIYSNNGDQFTIGHNTVNGDGTARVAFNSNGITLQDMNYTSVDGNTVFLTGAEGHCIYLDGEASGGGGGGGANPHWVGNSLTNNKAIGASLNGIYARVQDSANIANNFISAPRNSGILLYDTNDSSIANNIVNNVPDTWYNIVIGVTAAGDVCDNTTIRGNVMAGAQISGSGIRINSAAVSNTTVSDNNMSGLTALAFASKFGVVGGTNLQQSRNRFGTDPLSGIFTMAAAATTTVNNNNTSGAAYRVQIFPYNAAAAALVAGAKSPYVSTTVAGTSFTVATADGTNPAGTETFGYVIL